MGFKNKFLNKFITKLATYLVSAHMHEQLTTPDFRLSKILALRKLGWELVKDHITIEEFQGNWSQFGSKSKKQLLGYVFLFIITGVYWVVVLTYCLMFASQGKTDSDFL